MASRRTKHIAEFQGHDEQILYQKCMEFSFCLGISHLWII